MTPRVLCAAVLVSLWVQAGAGECVSATFVQGAKAYPIVLLGRAVTSRDEILSADRGMVSVVEFEVRQLWQGTTPKEIRLYQRLSTDSIQFEKALGVEYVIFARGLTGSERTLYSVPPNVTGLAIDYCVSKPAEGQDLRPLGKSRPPLN